MSHIAEGYFDNPFDDAHPGLSPPLFYSEGAWAYGVDTIVPPEKNGGLYLGEGVITTNIAPDQIVVTFGGDPVTALGGNFWAVDFGIQPTGTDITITLGDGTTQTFTSTGPDDFRGFTSQVPITSLTIDAPEQGAPMWPAMDNLIIGTAH